MSVELASLVMTIIGAYLATGVMVGIVLISIGLGRFDPAAASMSLRVRLLVLPGLVGLWPLMLKRFLRREGPPIQ